MPKYLTIAAAQVGGISLHEDKKSVVKRLITLLHEAHRQGAEFVVYPELTLTTFFPRYWRSDKKEFEKFYDAQMPGPDTQPLFDEAKKLGIGFHLGYAEQVTEDGKIRRYNTAILVNPDGQIVGKYRKVHLPGTSEVNPEVPLQHLEKYYFDVGNLGFPVFYAHDSVIGMAICNDRRWPETFRVMALQGAEMVVLGYNTPTTNVYTPDEPLHFGMFHHRLCMQAAAYQNGIWVVGTAKSGDEDGNKLFGGSCIISPRGEIVAQTLTEGDEVVVFKADIELGEYIRKSMFNFAKHRRPEHYGIITSQAGVQVPKHIQEKMKAKL